MSELLQVFLITSIIVSPASLILTISEFLFFPKFDRLIENPPESHLNCIQHIYLFIYCKFQISVSTVMINLSFSILFV